MGSAPQFSQRLRDVQASSFPTLNRYWSDPAYRRRLDAETEHARKLAHDAMDQRLEATGNRWPPNWTEQEKRNATRRWNEGKV